MPKKPALDHEGYAYRKGASPLVVRIGSREYLRIKRELEKQRKGKPRERKGRES